MVDNVLLGYRNITVSRISENAKAEPPYGVIITVLPCSSNSSYYCMVTGEPVCSNEYYEKTVYEVRVKLDSALNALQNLQAEHDKVRQLLHDIEYKHEAAMERLRERLMQEATVAADTLKRELEDAKMEVEYVKEERNQLIAKLYAKKENNGKTDGNGVSDLQEGQAT